MRELHHHRRLPRPRPLLTRRQHPHYLDPVADPGPRLTPEAVAKLRSTGTLHEVPLSDNLSEPWSVASADQTGQDLKLVYLPNDCYPTLGAATHQTPDYVEITLVAQRDALGPNEMCTFARGSSAVGIVHLNAPLGQRTLIHAPTDSLLFGPHQVYQDRP